MYDLHSWVDQVQFQSSPLDALKTTISKKKEERERERMIQTAYGNTLQSMRTLDKREEKDWNEELQRGDDTDNSDNDRLGLQRLLRTCDR